MITPSAHVICGPPGPMWELNFEVNSFAVRLGDLCSCIQTSCSSQSVPSEPRPSESEKSIPELFIETLLSSVSIFLEICRGMLVGGLVMLHEMWLNAAFYIHGYCRTLLGNPTLVFQQDNCNTISID